MLRKLFLSFFLYALSVSLTAQPTYVSHTMAGNRLVVFATGASYSLVPYGDDMLRFAFHFGPDTTYPASIPVVMAPQGTATLEENSNDLIYTTSGFEVHITKSPLYFNVYHDGEAVFSEGYAVKAGDGTSMRFSTAPTSAWYGGGSRAIPMDRSGRNLAMYNSPHYGYGWDSDPLNISIPMVVSSEGYGLYFETNSTGFLSLGSANPGLINCTSDAGPLSCFIITADDISDLMAPYTTLTGRQPLPPLWALGYLQSRFGYEDEQQVWEVVNGMQAGGFPLDALIFDLQWQGGPGVMGNLTWDTGRFPDPEGMMSNMEALGVKSIIITDPYFTQASNFFNILSVLNWFGTDYGGTPYLLDNFWAGPACLFDLTNTDANNWFWSQYHRLIEDGVAGLWTDLGEPELIPDDMYFFGGEATVVRQQYNLRWQQLLYESYSTDYPGRRLFNLSRSGYAGMQRFGAIPWSGDVSKSFSGMLAQLPIMMGMGLCGVGFMSSDIGGFTGMLDPPLYTRWMQMGAFTPVMRAHGTGDVPPEPIYYSDPYKSVVRDFIKLRYRMLPYVYSLAWENHLTGTPLVRPLFFEDPSMVGIDDEYLFGDKLLVAPLFSEEESTRTVIFPAGSSWIDFFNWGEYPGSSTATVTVPLEKIPVYARAGAMVPMLPEITNTTQYTGNLYQVRYFPDPEVESVQTVIYMDDGMSREYETQSAYTLIELDASLSASLLQINMTRSGNGYDGEQAVKQMEFDIARITAMPDEALFTSGSLTRTEDPAEYAALDQGVLFLLDESRLLVKVQWDSSLPGELRLGRLQIGSGFGIAEAEVLTTGLFPNPVTEGSVLRVDAKRKGMYRFTLCDQTGRTLMNREVEFGGSGQQQLRWTELYSGDLPAGIYFVKIFGPEGAGAVKAVVL